MKRKYGFDKVTMVNSNGMTKKVPFDDFNMWALPFVFGPLVSMVRGAMGQFFVEVFLAIVTFGFYLFVLPVTINKRYIQKLTEKGWKLDETDVNYELAKKQLNKGFNWTGFAVILSIGIFITGFNIYKTGESLDSLIAETSSITAHDGLQYTQDELDFIMISYIENTAGYTIEDYQTAGPWEAGYMGDVQNTVSFEVVNSDKSCYDLQVEMDIEQYAITNFFVLQDCQKK